MLKEQRVARREPDFQPWILAIEVRLEGRVQGSLDAGQILDNTRWAAAAAADANDSRPVAGGAARYG